jgi:hypothetical protein
VKEASNETIAWRHGMAILGAAHRVCRISDWGLRAVRPAMDRLLTPRDIHVAEAHLRGFGVDPTRADSRGAAP